MPLIDHHVRPLGAGFSVGAFDRHFLGDGEVVVLRLFPVDQPDRDMVLARARLHLHPIAQQVINLLVAVVEVFAGVASRLVQLVKGTVDEVIGHSLLLQPGAQQFWFDVGVAKPVDPVAQVVVLQPLAEQRNDVGLGLLLDLADGAHGAFPFRSSVSKAIPLSVMRYCCKRLFGLSGIVNSTV